MIADADGSILFRHSLMANDSYNYRVWASTSSPFLPHDGPQGTSSSPHSTGTPDLYAPPYVAPSLVSLQNSPFSHNDPWLPPGATVTNGNNVDAYADINGLDGFQASGNIDIRASTTIQSIAAGASLERVYAGSAIDNVIAGCPDESVCL